MSSRALEKNNYNLFQEFIRFPVMVIYIFLGRKRRAIEEVAN